MGFKFCCVGSSDSSPAPIQRSPTPVQRSQAPVQRSPVPIPRPPVLTPKLENLPALPNHKIGGPSPNSSPTQISRQVSAVHPAVATLDAAPARSSGSVSVRRRSSFTSPTFGMVSGRTPLSAWHSVASKVVAANRFRGIGEESPVQEFKIEELGGQNGKLVFGPVAVFNGSVSLRVKRPLKKVTLAVTFKGIAEVEKYLVTFISISHDVYVGDINEGLGTFLFGFNFPHLNLPPTSGNPQLGYSFTARLTNGTVADDSASIKPGLLDCKSKPLEIIFIPYIDPFLDSPHIPRTSPKERNEKGKGVESIEDKPADSTDCPVHGATGSEKPKLTLTTADLPSSASSNSTPIIDKPRSLNPPITRTARIKDDDNKTVARITVDLPKTKFLPDEDIVLRLRLTVRDLGAIPKGFGVRVVERRFLARIDSGSDDEGSGSDGEEHPREMKVIGKKQSKVIAGRKSIINPEEAYTVKETKASGSDEDEDATLMGGKEIEQPIKVRLPTFQAFINDSLLPSATLPLGPSDVAMDSAPAIAHVDGRSDSIYSGKGKGKSPALSLEASSPTTATSISMSSANKGLNFVVSHILQVTVPINGSGSWFKKSTSATRDLEVAIPIVLGNINSSASTRKKTPELRLNTLEEIRYGSGVRSSRSSGRSSLGSTSGVGPSGPAIEAASNKVPIWKEGERFLTLKETDVHPSFVNDS